jgi:prevent-host-death family protein
MSTIGVRELRQRTTEVLRQVREKKAEYIITHQGKPVALLLPVDTEAVEQAMLETGKQTAIAGWETFDRLAEEIRQAWPAEYETQSILDEIRR